MIGMITVKKYKPLLVLAITIIMLIPGTLIYAVAVHESKPTTIRVACVGDSITESSGYPTTLQNMLGQDYTVRNFGVSGSTVVQNSKIPYMNQPDFKFAQIFNPDVIVIMLGTNDANPEISHSEENFEQDYTQLISTFQNLDGDEQIFIVKSPPIYSTTSNYNNTYLSTTILPHLDSIADQMDLPTIDMNTAFSNHSDYFTDGVHPTEDGSYLIATQVYDAIVNTE